MKGLMKYVLLLLSCAALSVSAEDDFGGNISVELSKKLSKKIDISLEEEVRLTQNMSHFDRLASTLGADFKLIKKHLKGGVAYSALLYNEMNYCLLNHRAIATMTGSANAGNFEFSLRARYQATFQDESYGNSHKVNPKQIVRGKASVEYEFAKIKLYPYISAEAYYEIAKKDCNRVKYAVGAKKKINRHNSVSAGFLFDDKLKSNNYYLQLGYNYKF